VDKFVVGKIYNYINIRWVNILNPEINKEKWTIEEDKILMEAFKIHGKYWKGIIEHLPGRT
jgi:myb proto-oncogene protein